MVTGLSKAKDGLEVLSLIRILRIRLVRVMARMAKSKITDVLQS